jgi:hypothetical protein
MSEFTTYQNFFDTGEAEPVLAVLKEKDIPFKFSKVKQRIDTVITGTRSDDLYQLRIPSDRFEEVNRLLESVTQVDLNEIDKDYYLFSFSDDELKDILLKADEWSPRDYVLARKLLQQKGIPVSDNDLALYKKQRLEELAKPEELKMGWRLLMYAFTFTGGLIGIFMGLAAWQSKKTLPDGSKVYTYNKKSRQLALFIMIVSAVIFAVFLFTNLIYILVDWLGLFWIWQ